MFEKIKPIFFIFSLSFFNPIAQAEIKIAFVDTGFCPQENISKIYDIHPPVDFSHSERAECKKTYKKYPRYHGQLVLDEFLLKMKLNEKKLSIYPLVVFNERGEQKAEYWLKAIEWIKNQKIDVVVSAAGLLTSQKMVSSLPGIWFISSGRIGPFIKKETQLFPQNLAPLKNLFLIGDYFEGETKVFDRQLLYQEHIDYFFPSGEFEFMGTSRAVAEAAAKALMICDPAHLRVCLEKSSKIINDPISKKEMKTF